ncbi:hypothetical protein B0T17DRAFT_531018 [Bombardia bombarda]|uniref:Uncharacterized protein n=1 Tax=Bombardia bombarda TaxID=252184 RepID=A0AA39X009_9PEZI|nr:hypothetical protein B0T17DRAFT_531018 [Bombardia bombarda]
MSRSWYQSRWAEGAWYNYLVEIFCELRRRAYLSDCSDYRHFGISKYDWGIVELCLERGASDFAVVVNRGNEFPSGFVVKATFGEQYEPPNHDEESSVVELPRYVLPVLYDDRSDTPPLGDGSSNEESSPPAARDLEQEDDAADASAEDPANVWVSLTGMVTCMRPENQERILDLIQRNKEAQANKTTGEDVAATEMSRPRTFVMKAAKVGQGGSGCARIVQWMSAFKDQIQELQDSISGLADGKHLY